MMLLFMSQLQYVSRKDVSSFVKSQSQDSSGRMETSILNHLTAHYVIEAPNM